MNLKDHQESIKSQWDAVQSKIDELQILRKKLNCSLAIQTLWPEAFQLGKVTSNFKGNMHYHTELRKMKFVIKAGDQSKEFSIFVIPEILLDRQIQAQIKDKDSLAIWEKFRIDVYRIKKSLTLHK